MNNTIIIILLLLIIIGILYKESLKTNKNVNVEKKKVKIVKPSYWITPEGPSWKPPHHKNY